MLLFQAPEPTKAPTRRTRKVTVTTPTTRRPTPATGPDQAGEAPSDGGDKVDPGAATQAPDQAPDQATDRAETKPSSRRRSGGRGGKSA